MTENNYCVYKHTCPDGVCYVGMTGRTPEERWMNGFGYQNSNYTFFKKIVKFGWDNIKHEILYTGLDEKEARRLEKLEIEKNVVHACNVVGVKTQIKSIPKNPMDVLVGLSDVEKLALDLWAGEGYEGEVLNLKYYLYTHHYIARTVVELESGDPTRIEKERVYINENLARVIRGRWYIGKTVCFNGEEKTYSEWGKDPRVSVSGNTIRHRIEKRGWSVEDALFSTSVREYRGSPKDRQKVWESYRKQRV